MLDTAQCKVLQPNCSPSWTRKEIVCGFNYLGKRYENKIEHFGNQRSYQPEAPLIL